MATPYQRGCDSESYSHDGKWQGRQLGHDEVVCSALILQLKLSQKKGHLSKGEKPTANEIELSTRNAELTGRGEGYGDCEVCERRWCGEARVRELQAREAIGVKE